MATERMEDGTARMDAGTARMDGSKGGAATTAGVVFVSGQTIVLNGKDCVIDSVISGNTGEAIVYKVTIDNKPYALKLYKPNMPLSDTAKKVITKIKDKPKDRVIRIFDFGKYNEQDFEIMEYAEGGTLEQFLKSSGAVRDTTKIKNIVKMITEGLEQLHKEYKVIYQDLKPENIYFKDANKTSLVLADFGISSVMEGYDEEVEVTASITDLYAAPELAHKGNRNEVMVTPAVDYYALGITMFELWLGEKPFKGVKAAKRDYMIAEEKTDFPIDMPDDYATIIRGLIKPQRKERWGNEQVRKWLKGEALTLESKAAQKASTAYEALKFSNTESAASPKELAALMEKYPDIGKTVLYDGIIKEWCKKASDLELYNKIQNITSQYKDKDAGLYTAILTLDPERPFRSKGGKICKTAEDIANAIMAESAYYMEDLKKSNANLYLYLAETEGSQGKEAADIFCKNFREYSPKRALALVYFKLQGDGGITIGNKRYQSPNELKNEKDSAQIDLVKKAVKEKDSMLLVWLSDIYGDNLKSTDTFNNLSVPEQFFLLGLLPYLSFKEFNGDSLAALRELIDTCPGRSDLFETYAVRGMPLKQIFINIDKTPIDYVVCNFSKLSNIHSPGTIRNMISLLCKLGADVNEYSDDGTCPLINAYNETDNALVKLLLELGADENNLSEYKYKKLVQVKNNVSKFPSESEYQKLAKEFFDMKGYKDSETLAKDCENQIRILKERRAEQERLEKEKRVKQEAARKREEAKYNRITVIGHIFLFIPIIAGMTSCGISVFNIFDSLFEYLFNSKIDYYYLKLLISFLLSLIGIGLPLVLIFFRKLYGLFILVFLAAITVFTCVFFNFIYDINEIVLTPYIIGTVAVLVAFILTLAYPKEKKMKNLAGVLITVIPILLAFVFVITMQTVSFFDFQQNDRGTLTVTGYYGKKEVVIPAAQKGVSVTEIGDNAFNKKMLTSVTIPDSVTAIGVGAFANNRLSSITIPDSVTTIGVGAFAENQINSVTIPDSITLIEARVFAENHLSSIFISKSVTSIGKGAFVNNQLSHVDIPDGITKIEDDVFAVNRLTSVIIPNSVTSIGNGAFSVNALNNVTIPNSVTEIGDSAFKYNGITSVVIPNSVKSIGINAFSEKVTSVRIGANVILGSNYVIGILGKETGFNDAYDKNGKRAGTYTRPNEKSTVWTRK
jgi:serine/threonine protein kinase